ncbi:hypothetical protein L1889_07280 [Paenalcaligenes niemegkensis]|uniref:hypothetical protein n=1 Tax=Paenalcaligenes niemegkensis TaxID=2895469 RepID=UPI001EE8AD56|nr:hypothetical protein [Paenalcaligenes niemegkensis]MCQ9616533.1 hypothetical protein [Paenalcaligenes niemegkensis]
MRRLIFISFLLLGIGAGLLTSLNDDWGLWAVMMCAGALFGAAIGGALASIGRRHKPPRISMGERYQIPGMGTSGADIAANYWRDRGNPPLTRSCDGEPAKQKVTPREEH